MTTQVMFMPPSLVRDFASTGEIEVDEFIQDILTKEIGMEVKQLLLDEFMLQLDGFFDDMNKAREDAIGAYSSLQKIITDLYEDKKTISEIQDNYSPILSSNFIFALRNFSGLLQILLIGIQQAELPEKKLPKKIVRKLEKDMRRIIASTGNDMPDATQISNDDEVYESLLAGTIFGFNVALFMTLVVILAAVVQSRTELSEFQLEQMEATLRDWTQETMAQLALVTGQNKSNTTIPDLQGIIADDEDAIIVEEGLQTFDSDME